MANKTLYRKIQDQIRMNLIQMKQLEIEILKLKTEGLEHQLQEMKTKEGKTVQFAEKVEEVERREEEKLQGIPYNLTLGDDYAVGLFPYKEHIEAKNDEGEELKEELDVMEEQKMERLGDNYALPKKLTGVQMEDICSINANHRSKEQEIIDEEKKKEQDDYMKELLKKTESQPPIPYNVIDTDDYATPSQILDIAVAMKTHSKPVFPCEVSSITTEEIDRIKERNKPRNIPVFLPSVTEHSDYISMAIPESECRKNNGYSWL
jgi:hypothetical protein